VPAIGQCHPSQTDSVKAWYRFSEGLVTGTLEVQASGTMGAAAAQLLELYYIP
jgi:hypothetical protein